MLLIQHHEIVPGSERAHRQAAGRDQFTYALGLFLRALHLVVQCDAREQFDRVKARVGCVIEELLECVTRGVVVDQTKLHDSLP